MLTRYRAMLAERGHNWGDERTALAWSSFVGACDRNKMISEFRQVIDAGDAPSIQSTVAKVVLRSLKNPLPSGYAVVRPDGIDIPATLPFIFGKRTIDYHILNLSEHSAGSVTYTVAADNPHLAIDGNIVRVADVVPYGRVRLRTSAISRWSVTDERGGAWFPEGVLHKFDLKGLPYFHGNDVVVEVPIGTTTVTVSRGCEFRSCYTTIEVPPDSEIVVDLKPDRIYDGASTGWYSADLHVHMNYSGDQVCAPRDVARMQLGEGLHLMNLVAGNASTALIYDREAFEHFIGFDLPWSTETSVARWGVEYRNNLLGHFTALNPSAPPKRYQTGHTRSHEPHDWPPNATAAAEFRDLGATIGYTHPVIAEIGCDGSPAEVFMEHSAHHVPSARELVADAALGLVDSMDLTPPSNVHGAEYVYHRLLSCGLRLAATAGTDVFLSHMNADPPGAYRAYADLQGAPLSVAAWQEAVSAGRTFVTNGPWLELDVAGRGLGETVACLGPCSIPVRATATGPNIERLEIVGPDGVLAATELASGDERAVLTTNLNVTEPLWLAAVARGGEELVGLWQQPRVFAHSSPVWVETSGRSIARPVDAEWCLDWLQRFENLVRKVGKFASPDQLNDLIEILSKARTFYREIVTTSSN